MKSILKFALIGLLALSTAAYAGGKKKKQHSKKAEATCPTSCPHTGSCH